MAKTVRTARAILPNAGVEAWYRERLQYIIRRMSQDVLDAVRKAWKESPPAIDGAPDAGVIRVFMGMPALAQDAPNSSILLRRALAKMGGLWIKRLDGLSNQLATQFADKSFKTTDAALKKSFRDAGLTVRFKASTPMKNAYQATIAQQVGLIKSIPQKYLTDVQTAVWNSVMAGRDMPTLAKELREKYGLAHRRAALIARDQNNKAKAVLERVRRQELGITEAIWLHSHAGKDPRPTHVAMDGKRFKLNKGMYDKAVGKYIFPGEEINCRCTSKSVLPGD